MIERACENLTETLGYFGAWISLLDGKEGTVAATASAGLNGEFVALRDRLTRGEFPSCMAQTLESDAVQVVDDPRFECTGCPLAGSYPGRAGFARRLAFHGKTYGILAVSVPREYAQDAEELGLFGELADDLSFALHKIELAAKLSAADKRFRATLRAALAPEGDADELELADVLDAPVVQGMMDDFFAQTGISMAVTDLKGKTLVASRWQDMCTKFHRANPDAERQCIESNIVMSSGVEPGSCKVYRCSHNLWDVVTPIMLGGRHGGNLFLGQFILADEEPDRETFRAQARRYGFDEAAYLAALDRLPRWSRERVTQAMSFYAAFARLISDLSYSHIKLARSLIQRDELLDRLGHNEERLRVALKATNDVVWDWDIVNDSQRWNESGTAVFGWTDIVQAPQTAGWWVERVHPEDRSRVDAAFFAAVEDPTTDRWADEYRFRKADGEYACVVDRGYILRGGDGRAVRMIGAMLDITERKRAEEDLRRNRHLLDATEELSAIGGWEWDPTVQSMTWTDGTYHIHDLDPVALPAGSPDHISRSLACYDPEDRARVIDAFRRCAEEGEAYDLECGFTTAAGRRLRVRTIGRAVWEGGRISKVLGNLQDITEQREREEALRRSEWSLRHAQRIGAIGNWEWDITAGRLTWSDELYRIWGVSPDFNLTYDGIVALIHPDDRAKNAEMLEELLASADEIEHRLRIVTPDGQIRHLSQTAEVFRAPSGEPVRAFGIMQDITRRVEAEEALRQSREVLRAVLDNIPVRVFWKDTDFNYLGCNLAFARDAGFEDPQDLVGRDDYAMGWRDQAELYRGDDRMVMEHGEPRLLYEEPQTTPTGDVIHLLTSKAPLRDAQGAVIGVLGTYMDITEIKRAEQARRESEERFRAANEATLDALLLLRSERDADGEICDFIFVDLNRRAEEMLQMRREDLLGRRLCEALPINREAGFFEKYKRVAETGVPLEEEFFLPETHVPACWYYHQVVRVGDGIFICNRDIGERKAAEREREELTAQLLQAQKLESIGLLAGGVAHDFNNMLSIILGYGEMLLEQLQPGDPMSVDVEEMVEAARRSSDLTRQLLAFGRRQTLQPGVFLLNDIVSNFDRMLRRIIGEDVELDLVLGKDVGHVLVDRGQIEQVITNLGVNARDAMPAGGRLTIETGMVDISEAEADKHPCATPGRYAMLAFTDSGCGMDEELQLHIFEPFFTTKGIGKGTGLGLSTVYGIVKQSNGIISVSSEPGKGTTFKVLLPDVSPTAGPATDTVQQPVARGEGERVLVVEDEVSLRKLLEEYLSGLGYHVTVAAGGSEALRLLEEGLEPVLILTDVVMPGMSGKELADHLRGMCPKAKVLFMSGYSNDIIVDHGVVDPRRSFLQKPFTMSDLAGKVAEVLRGIGSGTE